MVTYVPKNVPSVAPPIVAAIIKAVRFAPVNPNAFASKTPSAAPPIDPIRPPIICAGDSQSYL